MAKRRKTVKKKVKKKKVVKKKPASKKDSIHVKLEAPITKRKAILAAAISIVELLKHYETIKEIRKEKAREMEKLRVLNKEISKLYRAIKVRDMPLKTKDLDEMHGKKEEKVPEVKPVPKPVLRRPAEVKPVSRKISNDPLERQLDELRRKLDSL